MKTFEDFNNIDEKKMEEIFLQLVHLDELEISFRFLDSNNNLTSCKYYLWYYYNNHCYFEINRNKKYFWIDDASIFNILSKEIIDYNSTMKFIKKMIDKYFVHKNYGRIITS